MFNIRCFSKNKLPPKNNFGHVLEKVLDISGNKNTGC
jgi:hypothetical protein